MAASKIAITIDDNLFKKLDLVVKSKAYPNRSKAIQEAVADKLSALKEPAWHKNAQNLTPEFEQNMAEEGFSTEIDEWSKY